MTLLDSDGKIAVIQAAAEQWPDHDVFIETGTALGDLCLGVADLFDAVYTIEMAPDYYESATKRLLGHANVKVIHGDSARWLGVILSLVDRPAVIWLDAHAIVRGGPAAMREEMKAIARDANRHVILIDDARLCNGRKGWMTLSEIKDWAIDHGYRHLGVTDDVVTLTP